MKTTLIFGAALFAGAAFADKVTLKSGSFLTGETGIIRDGKLCFKSDDLGDLKIDLANIKAIDEAKTHVIQYNDNSTETKILTVKDGELWNGEGKLDTANVKAIDPAVETWHGSIHAGFNATRGNTFETAGSVAANANRRWEKDRLNLDFGYYYSESAVSGADKKKTEDRWEAEAKHDHFWLAKVYSYEDLKWERDEIKDLNARYRVGIGGGYQWLENAVFASTGKWSFNQEFGVNWIKEEYAHGGDAEKGGFCALRYGHHLNYLPKWVDGLSFFHNLEVLPDVADWEKFLANADVGFTTKLILDFDLIAKIEWEYNSQPAGDRRKNDYRYIVGLGYVW